MHLSTPPQRLQMIPYLVTAEIRKQQYMSGTDIVARDTRIVLAESVEEAQEKFKSFWQSKTDEYSVYYSLNDVEVHETLV